MRLGFLPVLLVASADPGLAQQTIPSETAIAIPDLHIADSDLGDERKFFVFHKVGVSFAEARADIGFCSRFILRGQQRFLPDFVAWKQVDPANPIPNQLNYGLVGEVIMAIIAPAIDRSVRQTRMMRCMLPRGYARYRATPDTQVPRPLVERAEQIYLDLCASQRSPRLLHGDLHHYNVLLDRARGWTAIDPKGVVGEIEYEIGAAMRNPVELPDLVTDRRTIERRLTRFCSALDLDAWRVMRWCYSQAVLSAIWGVEDGDAVGPDNLALRLATVLEPMLA